MGEFSEKVFQVVAQIPSGKVATYGQVARLIGSARSARYVGFALRNNPSPTALEFAKRFQTQDRGRAVDASGVKNTIRGSQQEGKIYTGIKPDPSHDPSSQKAEKSGKSATSGDPWVDGPTDQELADIEATRQLIPCHRVVFADGSLCRSFAFGGPEVQRAMLQEEGVTFVDDDHIDLADCQWDGTMFALDGEGVPEGAPTTPPADFDWAAELGES